jgi:hypothetical protein
MAWIHLSCVHSFIEHIPQEQDLSDYICINHAHMYQHTSSFRLFICVHAMVGS